MNALKIVAVGFVGSAATGFIAAAIMHFFHTYYLSAIKVGCMLGLLAAVKAYFILFRWSSVKRFLSGYTLAALVACMVFITVAATALLQTRQFSKTKGISITYDEVSILPAGYFYRQTGTYYINPEHPPLVKFIAALPTALMEQKMPNETLPKDVLLQDYAQYYWGKIFLFESKNKTEEIIFYARLAVLITNVVLFFALYLSLAYLWNKRAAWFALLFILASPFTMAHAMLVTVDVMAATLSVLTLVWFGVFLRDLANKRPVKCSGAISAVALAGALLAKFSAILLVPIMLMSAAAYILVQPKSRKNIKQYILSNLAMFSFALFLIILFYTWHVRAMSTDQLVEQLRYNFAKDDLPNWLHSLVEQIAHFGILGRAFAEFLLGLIKVNTRIAKGAGGVYFLGKFYGAEGAGPLYFPLLYVTKLPIVFHIATITALVVALRKGVATKLSGWKAAIQKDPSKYLLIVYGLIFMLISIGSTLQIGLRHIFPAIFCFVVVTAVALDAFLAANRNKKTSTRQRVILFVGGLWLVVSMLTAYPHFLSYFNELGGGTNNGYRLATDSNYDWGQDLKELAAWQQQNNVTNLYVDLFTNPFLPKNYYLGDGAIGYKIATDKKLPAGAYLAVSANQYENNVGQDMLRDKDYELYKGNQVARVGKSIFVFRVPAN